MGDRPDARLVAMDGMCGRCVGTCRPTPTPAMDETGRDTQKTRPFMPAARGQSRLQLATGTS